MEDTSDFQFSISDNSNDSFNEKKNEFIPKYRKKSNSPNYLIKILIVIQLFYFEYYYFLEIIVKYI